MKIDKKGFKVEPFGYELDDNYKPLKKMIDIVSDKDYGCDPFGDGMFKMVPSGDVVNAEEKNNRLR